jgi:MFS family permease
VSGSAGAVGLLIGGLLTSYVNWRWCMYVNIAFAAAGIIGGLALLHHVSAPDKPRLSVTSTIIGSAALFGLVFGAAKAQTDGWGAALTGGPLAAGAALLAVFVVVQRYDRSPLIPLRVLADRNRGAAYLVLLVANAGVFAVFLFLTYYLQGVLHYSPIRTGLAFLPLPVAIAVVATITQGPLLKVATMRAIVTGGLLACGAGAVLLAQATAATPRAKPRRSAPPCTASPPATGGRPAFTSAAPSSWAP